MDDNAKNASSYHLDQEILDARGINMTVEEVAGLPTGKYSQRVQSLKLPEDDLAFLKGLRRRIKNRLASQNSRRRSMEHLRRLSRELRAVRACLDDARADRIVLEAQRDKVRERCQRLREYLAQTLRDRLDTTEVPKIEVNLPESHADLPKDKIKEEIEQCAIDKTIFECRIDKLVQKSVNHMFNNNIINNNNKKTIFARTVFIDEDKSMYDVTVTEDVMEDFDNLKGLKEGEVLNLSVKNEGRRKSHGRKQLAPRRITYVDYDVTDCVLDLKIKKEPQ